MKRESERRPRFPVLAPPLQLVRELQSLTNRGIVSGRIPSHPVLDIDDSPSESSEITVIIE